MLGYYMRISSTVSESAVDSSGSTYHLSLLPLAVKATRRQLARGTTEIGRRRLAATVSGRASSPCCKGHLALTGPCLPRGAQRGFLDLFAA